MNYFKLARTPLFAGTTEEEIKQMLTCLKAVERNYKKGETIYCAGDVTTEIGLVLSGSVLIENVDAWGNCSVLDKVGEGRIFAESYACVPGERLMVNVTAQEPAGILFLDVTKMLQICPNACSYHQKLLKNLLSHGKICVCREGFLIPRQNPSGGGCYPIFRMNPCSMRAVNLIFPITDSS